MPELNPQELYGRELHRLLWFERAMEATRNLSVLSLAGMSLFTFGDPQTSSHLVLILGSLIIFLFQMFEAHAFQYAEASADRVREIERNYLAPALEGREKMDDSWRSRVAASLQAAKPATGFIEAFAARVVRNYILIFLTLDICWFTKLYLFPDPAADWPAFVHRLDSGALPGWFFLVFAGAFWTIYFGLAIWYLIKQKKKREKQQ